MIKNIAVERLRPAGCQPTRENWNKFISNDQDSFVLECLDNVCMHSPDSEQCVADREIRWFPTYDAEDGTVDWFFESNDTTLLPRVLENVIQKLL